jgi:predicted DCC family thiol-disulfide oxidoreductase YuxK
MFVYDGDCGFCRRWADWLEHRVGADARFVPFQAIDLATLGLAVDDVRTASYLVEDGRLYRGGRGVARAMANSRGGWRLVGMMLDLPVVRIVTASAYRLIARNRHRLPAPSR